MHGQCFLGTKVRLIFGALSWRPSPMQRWRRRSVTKTGTQGGNSSRWVLAKKKAKFDLKIFQDEEIGCQHTWVVEEHSDLPFIVLYLQMYNVVSPIIMNSVYYY